MRFLPILSVVFSGLSPAVLLAGCLPVSGDRIQVNDLASANAKFSALPSTAQLGYAPPPGTIRIFTAAEQQRIAYANGIHSGGFAEVCFEVPLHIPADADFIESMRHVLPAEAKLRIVEMARASLPSGRLEFPLSGLEPSGSDGTQLWRGYVQYTDTRRIAIWAHVAIAVAYTAVVARRSLGADSTIDEASLQIETRTGPLKREVVATRIEEVAGRVVRRTVKAGAEIPLSLVDEPPAVHRGDLVRIEVRSGLAVLHFDAVAQTTVRAGEFAEFRNPVTGKTFRARAEDGSKAVFIVGKGPAL